LYLGRKINRGEIASRISAIDAKHLQEVCKKWFVDAEPAFTSWGPSDQIWQQGLYKSHRVELQNRLLNRMD